MLTESAFRNLSGRLFVIVALPYGLADLPNAARQRPLLFDVREDGTGRKASQAGIIAKPDWGKPIARANPPP
jgi:hypothetical protein